MPLSFTKKTLSLALLAKSSFISAVVKVFCNENFPFVADFADLAKVPTNFFDALIDPAHRVVQTVDLKKIC